MIYGVILAGGNGSRMGNVERAKPFLMLGNKPIIIHTIEKFMIHDSLEKILVLCPAKWMNHARDIVEKYLKDNNKVVLLEGGATRNDTIRNAVSYIDDNDGLDDETSIVTHDAVRPFVTWRIIEENIQYVSEYGACDTVIAATDTIVESEDGITINSIPKRTSMYQGQTPQSFKAKKLKEIYDSLNDHEKEILTDAAKIYTLKGETVYLVKGEVSNIKITFPCDLRIAEALLEEENA